MSGLFGGAKKATTHATRAMGIDFQGAQYGNVVPVVYGRNKVPGNCIWYGDFQSHAQQQKSGKGGGGGSTTNYTYSASAQMGLCEGPGIGLRTVYDGNSVVNLSSINYAFASGAIGQAAWSHLSGDAALGYSLTAIFSFQNLDLGSQATLPNYNYELDALQQYSGSVPDANPRDILSDICSDPYHGVNFPYLGDLTQYSNYCVANSLFLSPVYAQQQSANQALSDLFKYTNTYVYYSEDQLKVVPLGDVAVTGNGVTFTPNVTPVVNLGTDDFLADGSGATITIDRKAPQDNLNLVRVEFQDRANTYHDSAAVAAIDEDIITNGGRSDDSETVNGCTTAAVARFIAQNLVQRAFFVRNTYQFKLPWRYCYLEPTDIVTLTDAALGLSLYPVRITEIEEDGDSALTITAEEFPEGIGHSALYNTQPNGGTNIDQNADPGPVNPPFLFRGPGFLVGNNTPEIWCAVNGSDPMWAGCEVYLSHDGTSYTFAGAIASQARYGSLTAALSAGAADPDTTNTPTVELYAPGQLLGGSQTDADNFVTLAMIDTEVIAYETATLKAANTYQLGYLRRGGYGSGNVAHSAGAPFVRLDDSIFRIPVDPSLIGSTVYLKFLSINAFGRTPRTLADETAYTYVVGTNIELPDVPDVPASFAVMGVADGVSVTWTNDNPAAVGCTSIERATASGGPWNVLAQVGPTTTAYHDSFTNGATYYYRARARGPLVQSGWSTYTSILSSAGANVTGPGGLTTTVNSNQPLIINPYFTTGDLTGWTSDHGTVVFESGSNGPASASTTYARRNGSAGTPNEALRNLGKIPVYAGSVVKAQCAIRGINTPNGTAGVRISWRDASDTEISTTPGNTTTGNATNGTYVTGTAPAGAMFAHVECQFANHTTGSYTVDNFAASSLADSMDQVPDSATRFAAAQAGADKTASNPQPSTWLNDSSNLARGGDSITRFSGRTLDNISDTATYRRPGAGYVDSSGRVNNLWDGTTIRAASYLSDGATRARTGFDSSGILADGLHPLARLTGRTLDNISDSASRFAAVYTPTVQAGMYGPGSNLILNPNFALGMLDWSPGTWTASSTAGEPCAVVTLTGTPSTQTMTSNLVTGLAAGSALSASLELQMSNAPTSGDISADIEFYNSSGSVVGNSARIAILTAATTGFQRYTLENAICPANTASAKIRVFTENAALSGLNIRARRVKLELGANCTPFNDAATQHGNQLTNPGSGQTVGDQRNLLPVTWAGVRSVLSTSPISFSISGTTVNFSVAAVTVNAGGVNISYNASSGSVTQAAGTEVVYYLYYRDAAAAGGSQALHITTSVQALAAFPDIVLLGSADVTVASGGGGSGGTGSGGGGLCVADEMWIGPVTRAGDAKIGDPFDCIDLPTAAGKHIRALQGVSRGIEECVRMITDNGCALVCSVSTPFDLPDGRQTTALHMLGEEVITDLGTATVTSLALVGPRPVTRAHLGGVSYAAGADPTRRIYSHNALPPEKP